MLESHSGRLGLPCKQERKPRRFESDLQLGYMSKPSRGVTVFTNYSNIREGSRYIYQITNDINGKIYIGKTEFSIEKCFKEHCYDAFRDRNEKRPLYAAMRKYGIEHFHIELLEETDDPNEREVYWIEKKRSFKDGYNATIGGDGKRYIDYDLVINTYKKLLNQNETAKILNISPDSVHNILKENNIEIKSGAEISKEKNSMSVFMIDKKDNSIIRGFPSMADAARYLIDNQLTNCKMTTIRYHISEVCNGKRKTAAGYKWSFQ